MIAIPYLLEPILLNTKTDTQNNPTSSCKILLFAGEDCRFDETDFTD